MKKLYTVFLLLWAAMAAHAQGVGIGTTTPAPAAALDVSSTTQGLLLPRMTAVQRAAIASPPQGLFVFQTDGTPGLYYYIGTAWVNLSNGLIPDAAGIAGPSPTVQVSTLAGLSSGFADATGSAARFNSPAGVVFDGSGNLYVADASNNRIRKVVVATGGVTTVAGGATSGNTDGTNAVARLNTPYGVALDGNGNLFVADRFNHRIRKVVLATGDVSTVAGNGSGFADGTGTAALFFGPYGVAADGSGNLYVSDTNNNRIRKVVVATGVVTTVAGGSTAGSADGTGTAAQFSTPYGVAVDGSGNLYVAEGNNHRIRKVVVATGEVTTVAGSTQGFANGTGTAAQFSTPAGVALDGNGNLYVADQLNNRIRKVVLATGVVTTLAGSGVAGTGDGTGATVQFNNPVGVAVDGSGTLYVADQNNHRIRVVKP